MKTMEIINKAYSEPGINQQISTCHLFLYMFYWNAAIYLGIAYSSFHTTKAELDSCKRNHMVHKLKIFTTWPLTEKKKKKSQAIPSLSSPKKNVKNAGTRSPFTGTLRPPLESSNEYWVLDLPYWHSFQLTHQIWSFYPLLKTFFLYDYHNFVVIHLLVYCVFSSAPQAPWGHRQSLFYYPSPQGQYPTHDIPNKGLLTEWMDLQTINN